MDVEISISGHLIRKLVLCPIPEGTSEALLHLKY
jgi:hypothetical protein